MTLEERDRLFATMLSVILPEKPHGNYPNRSVTREVIERASEGTYRNLLINGWGASSLPLAFTSALYFCEMQNEVMAAWTAAYGELNPNILFENAVQPRTTTANMK